MNLFTHVVVYVEVVSLGKTMAGWVTGWRAILTSIAAKVLRRRLASYQIRECGSAFAYTHTHIYVYI